MENQQKANNKKLIAIVVAAVVLAAVLAGVYFGRKSGDQATDAPVMTATPESTEEPVVTEEPTEAPTEEPEVTEAPTEEPAATEAPTEEPAVTEAPTEAPAATEAPTEAPVAEVGGAEEPEAVAASVQTSPEDVMLVVNGEAVNRQTFENYRASLVNYFAQYGYDMTNEENLAFVGGLAMQSLVEDTILFQKATDLGLNVTDEERAQVEAENAAEWADAVEYCMTYYVGVAEDATDEEKADGRVNALALLESMGYTESALLENAIDNLRYEKAYAYMVQGAEVTDADIQATYEERVAEDKAEFEDDIAYYEAQQYYGYSSYYTPAGYRGVTHILLEVDQELLDTWQSLTAMLEEQQDEAEYAEENADEEAADAEEEEASAPVTQEQVDAAYAAIIASVQPTIDEIFRKLEEGTPFADLVAEYGTDPGMTVEPTKSEGYAVHMDSIMWDPAFVAGAFSVDTVGEVADPIVGSYGVHIIQYTRDIPAGAVELTDELKASLRDEVLSIKESELFEATLETWKSESEIVYSAEAQELVNYFEGDEE